MELEQRDLSIAIETKCCLAIVTVAAVVVAVAHTVVAAATRIVDIAIDVAVSMPCWTWPAVVHIEDAVWKLAVEHIGAVAASMADSEAVAFVVGIVDTIENVVVAVVVVVGAWDAAAAVVACLASCLACAAAVAVPESEPALENAVVVREDAAGAADSAYSSYRDSSIEPFAGCWLRVCLWKAPMPERVSEPSWFSPQLGPPWLPWRRSLRRRIPPNSNRRPPLRGIPCFGPWLMVFDVNDSTIKYNTLREYQYLE